MSQASKPSTVLVRLYHFADILLHETNGSSTNIYQLIKRFPNSINDTNAKEALEIFVQRGFIKFSPKVRPNQKPTNEIIIIDRPGLDEWFHSIQNLFPW